jgi:hypothetical protein
MKRNTRNKAFTLVELVGAIVIITILVGVVLVTTGSARERALQTRILADMEAINLAKGFWCLDKLGAPLPISETDRFNAIRKYLEVNRSYTNGITDFQPPGVSYQINALGIQASHTP